MIKFVAIKNNLPLSVLIRKGLGEPASHFAVVFDDKLVVHSNLYGVSLDYYPTWVKKNTIVDQVEKKDLTLEQEEEIFQSVMSECDEYGYDYPAFVYFGISVVNHRLFGQPMPTHNKWGSKKRLLCTGLYARLPAWLVGPQWESQLEMTTPTKLILMIRGGQDANK